MLAAWQNVLLFPVFVIAKCILAPVLGNAGLPEDDVEVIRYKAQPYIFESIRSIDKNSLPRSLALSAGKSLALAFCSFLVAQWNPNTCEHARLKFCHSKCRRAERCAAKGKHRPIVRHAEELEIRGKQRITRSSTGNKYHVHTFLANAKHLTEDCPVAGAGLLVGFPEQIGTPPV